MREAVICIRTRDSYPKRLPEAQSRAHQGLLWNAVFVYAKEYNIVVFAVLIDFSLVSEVRNYFGIDKSLLGQIRKNSVHIRVAF